MNCTKWYSLLGSMPDKNAIFIRSVGKDKGFGGMVYSSSTCFVQNVALVHCAELIPVDMFVEIFVHFPDHVANHSLTEQLHPEAKVTKHIMSCLE